MLDIEDQAVILVARVLVVPNGMVVLRNIDLCMVQVPLSVTRVGYTANYQQS